MTDERARIAAYYQQRAETSRARRYSLFQPGNLYRVQHFERDLLAALERNGFTHLDRCHILDVGCGDGSFLRRLIGWGAEPGHLAGIELLAERVASARRIDPQVDVRQADASALPFADASFDLVFQLTVFSSILDRQMCQAVATAMARVLRPGGAVVSYDFRLARDRRNTRPLRVAELKALFPDFAVDARSVTLLPPLAGVLAPWSRLLCDALETIPVLRAHELVILRKPASGQSTASAAWRNA